MIYRPLLCRTRVVLAPLALAAVAACAAHGATEHAVSGPKNAPVSALGSASGIALGDGDAAVVRDTARRVPAAVRGRLRYALAVTDDGSRRVVVYDPGTASTDAKTYVVPKVLNAADGSHYDPLENALIPPLR